MENKNRFEPYTSFFTFGLISALLGVSLWILFQFQQLSFFPRQSHAILMFYGFLWSFIAGFLMTAVPKMTGSQPAKPTEVGTGLALVAGQWTAGLLNLPETSAWLYLMQNVLLSFFVARRLLLHRRLPFSGFVFLPFAFAAGFLGPVVYFVNNSNSEFMYIFSGQAFVLNLICGIGSRLIPMMSKLPPAAPSIFGGPQSRKEIYYYLVLALLLNFSFVLEALGLERIAYAMRFLVFGWIALSLLRVHQKPVSKTHLGWGVKTGLVATLFSYGTLALGGMESPLAYLHLMFISGLSVITIMIASRVTVAHGGGHFELESQDLVLPLVGAALFLAALFRIFVGPSLDHNYLMASGVMFLAGLFWWAYNFGRILWRGR